jgi:hypothetical protein
MAPSLLCPPCKGWFAKCREPRLEGWAAVGPSGYSVNLQVRFLEGWAPATAPGYSILGITLGLPVNRK